MAQQTENSSKRQKRVNENIKMKLGILNVTAAIVVSILIAAIVYNIDPKKKQHCKQDAKTKENKLKCCELIANKKGEKKTIRIAVIGATGAGKSTLCNMICDQIIFPNNINKTKSFTFSYNIDNNKNRQQFEIIDCPALFDTNLPNTIEEISELENNIKSNWTAIEKPISLYLLLIPNERLNNKHVESMRFIQNYIDPKYRERVIIVFTKCNGKTRDKIITEFCQELEITSLINNDMIIATECKNGNITAQREIILKSIYNIHTNLNTMYSSNVITKAVESLQHEIEKKLLYSRVYKSLEVSVVAIFYSIFYYLMMKQFRIRIADKMKFMKFKILLCLLAATLQSSAQYYTYNYIITKLLLYRYPYLNVTRLSKFRNILHALTMFSLFHYYSLKELIKDLPLFQYYSLCELVKLWSSKKIKQLIGQIKSDDLSVKNEANTNTTKKDSTKQMTNSSETIHLSSKL